MATYTMGALKYYEDSLTVMKSMLSEIQIGNKHAGAYEKKEIAAPDASQFSHNCLLAVV